LTVLPSMAKLLLHHRPAILPVRSRPYLTLPYLCAAALIGIAFLPERSNSASNATSPSVQSSQMHISPFYKLWQAQTPISTRLYLIVLA
ncbi:hypothetical protein H2201_009276, partial [Coniosporium apollinis]